MKEKLMQLISCCGPVIKSDLIIEIIQDGQMELLAKGAYWYHDKEDLEIVRMITGYKLAYYDAEDRFVVIIKNPNL
tara:strand:+ start:306 stop:533 length:228 start_codon:yes stop_codon:yes gene_type:complete